VASSPTGTVTFLFTDIEGSTRLWENHTVSMKSALARHDRLMQASITRHGGCVFKTVGDAFCAAFVTALDGVKAALDSQEALLAEPWEVPGGIRVRMALHTGTAEERDGDYFGPTLNRVARLLSTGFGGQTLVSLVTAELLRDVLPEAVSLRDLGAHRLKDLLRPESVFQVVSPGLRQEFPALKSLDHHPNNLPLQPTPFIGREKELETAQRILREPTCRVLTLTGPGGAGKTRLALQSAADLIEDFMDGVYFIDLSSIDSAGHVLPAIARTMEIRESGGRPLLELLKDALKDRRMLLILDNFEQVMSGVPRVVELVGACPSLKTLVTSREALRIRVEKVLPVPPLPAPALRAARSMTPARLAQYEAVSLFIERAAAARPDFAVTKENAPAIAEICARLDGLPLAIELAAARTTILPPQAILDRLGNRLKLLTSGVADLPFRQRTLRATIDWSYRMLTPGEQMLFREASVFSGGATLETMEGVCRCAEDGVDILETLSSLVDKSLLWRDERPGSEARYSMLESIREFGLDVLSRTGAEKEIRGAHARHFLRFAEETERGLRGPDQRRAFDSLEEEHDNLDAAADWFHASPAVGEELRLCGALGPFYEVRGYLVEGREQLERALGAAEAARAAAGPAGGVPPAVEGKALRAAAAVARAQGRYDDCLRLLEESEAWCHEGGDQAGLLLAEYERGLCCYRSGSHELAAARFQAVLESAGERDPYLAALAELGLGSVKCVTGDTEGAPAHLERCRKVFAACGDDRSLARAFGNMLMVSYRKGDFSTALRIGREMIPVQERVKDTGLSLTLFNNLGNLCVLSRDFAEASAEYSRLLETAERVGHRQWACYAHAGLAEAELGLGRIEDAFSHGRQALGIAEGLGEGFELGVSRRVMGELYLARGQLREAVEALSTSLPLVEGGGDPAETARVVKSLAEARGRIGSA
jgi:predicted ATPase/class 3 adenylate cyclase